MLGQRCSNPILLGNPCDDGNECSVGETCDAGGRCSGGTSVCMCVSTADCATYEDGDLCNGTLFCEPSTHACVVDPATIVVCDPALDTECTYGLCDAWSGDCYPEPYVDGLVCDDGLYCTVGDSCDGGLCIGTARACPSGACGLPCDEVRDRCPAAAAGTVCRVAVGDCDVPETCDGTNLDCPADALRGASYRCRVGSGDDCNPDEYCTGSSPFCPDDWVRINGWPCDDRDPCTSPDECLFGECFGPPGVEVCNHVDDDCDGSTDEAVGCVDDVSHVFCPGERVLIHGRCVGSCQWCTCEADLTWASCDPCQPECAY